MPRQLQLGAATGGVSAALVSALLRPEPISPFCPEIFAGDHDTLHWPSVCLGVLLGLILAQILEYLILARHFFNLWLRQKGGNLTQATSIRNRLG